jgi:hypothetical protein
MVSGLGSSVVWDGSIRNDVVTATDETSLTNQNLLLHYWPSEKSGTVCPSS